MRSTSLSGKTCYPVVARVTAWQRAGTEDVSPAAQPSASFLFCGARALLRVAAPLPLADKALVGLFGMAGELDLTVSQLLDVVCVGGAALVSFAAWLAGLQFHRSELVRNQRRPRPLVIGLLGQQMPAQHRYQPDRARQRRDQAPHRGRRHLPQRGRYHPARRCHPARAERRMGRPARALHDPGNHRTFERRSPHQAARRRGSLTIPAQPCRRARNHRCSYTTPWGTICIKDTLLDSARMRNWLNTYGSKSTLPGSVAKATARSGHGAALPASVARRGGGTACGMIVCVWRLHTGSRRGLPRGSPDRGQGYLADALP